MIKQFLFLFGCSIFLFAFFLKVTSVSAACTGSWSCCNSYGSQYTPPGCNPSGCQGRCSGNNQPCSSNATCEAVYAGTCNPAAGCTPCTGSTTVCQDYIGGGCGGVGLACNPSGNTGVCAGERSDSCNYVASCSCGAWSACSATACGTTGTQTRSCSGSNCTGFATSRACSAPPCTAFCGNGPCDAGETCGNCPLDCGTCAPSGEICGLNGCNGGESCSTCPQDCGTCSASAYCGNGACDGGESCSSCTADCGSCAAEVCGNGLCRAGETCNSCVADCGACGAPEVCGNSVCGGSETCTNCPGDCGSCGGTIGGQIFLDTSGTASVVGGVCSGPGTAQNPGAGSSITAQWGSQTTPGSITGNSYIIPGSGGPPPPDTILLSDNFNSGSINPANWNAYDSIGGQISVQANRAGVNSSYYSVTNLWSYTALISQSSFPRTNLSITSRITNGGFAVMGYGDFNFQNPATQTVAMGLTGGRVIFVGWYAGLNYYYQDCGAMVNGAEYGLRPTATGVDVLMNNTVLCSVATPLLTSMTNKPIYFQSVAPTSFFDDVVVKTLAGPPPTTIGYHPNTIVSITPDLSQYTCVCPAGCTYSGLSAPLSGLNFYLTNARDSWWQIKGGLAYAAGATGNSLRSYVPTTCIAPVCSPGLMTRLPDGTVGSSGFAITGGGALDTTQDTATQYTYSREDTPSDQRIQGMTQNGPREDYSFFARQLGIPSGSPVTFTGSKPSGAPPGGALAYYTNQPIVISTPWTVGAGERLVIMVDSTVRIEAPITVAPGGFLSIIASGNITVANTVGNATLTDATPNVEGIFVSSSQFVVEGGRAGGDLRFVGAGTFVGWNGVGLQRQFANKPDNDQTPSEQFIYRPDILANTPEALKRPIQIWQETN
jgi:hypothetical protein